MRFFVPLLFLLSSSGFGQEGPDLDTLSKSSYIIGPGSEEFPIHRNWQEETAIMRQVQALDRVVQRVQEVVCGSEGNKGVLLVGEGSSTYKYVVARLANNALVGDCARQWTIEIELEGIESKWVGETEQNWKTYVTDPLLNKNGIAVFSNLSRLIGLGTHSNQDVGMEADFSTKVLAGALRTVAFMDKHSYAYYQATRHRYVLQSFAEVINIEDVTEAGVGEFLNAYISAIAPDVTLPQTVADYIIGESAYYQPNLGEPQRSLAILKTAIRNLQSNNQIKEFFPDVESAHPYLNSQNVDHEIKYDDVDKLEIFFEKIETEASYDKLTIFDEQHGGSQLFVLEGSLGEYRTSVINSNHLRLNFKSDGSGEKWGYKIAKVIGTKVVSSGRELSFHDIKRAIFEFVQVPQWMLDEDYTIIRDLQKNLDETVVGVSQGKTDLVRLAKIGYVTRRTDEKPIGSDLFVGPTGVGKSFIAKEMARVMGLKLITLDMTAYKDASTFNDFLDVMSQNLVLYPFAIYLFEEVDKANKEVLDRLYFLLDEGIFYDKYQRPLFARGAFVLMTTNAGSNVILENKDNPDLEELVVAELQKSFRESFLNRFDAITVFKPFTDEEFKQLATVLITKKLGKVKAKEGMQVEVEQPVIDYLAIAGRSDRYGARPMERAIENVISLGLAEYVLAYGHPERGSAISIGLVDSTTNMFKVGGDKGVIEYHVDPRNNEGFVSGTLEDHFLDVMRSE
ncbi:MAG: AAA family ATPase [Oligoflexales bacterium]